MTFATASPGGERRELRYGSHLMKCMIECLAKAVEMEKRAADAKSIVAKEDFLVMGASWRGLAVQARALETAEARMDRGYRPLLASA